MFLDETHNWPRDETPRRPSSPLRRDRVAARLFLILALTAAFLPFSLAAVVDIVRYLLADG